MKIAFLHLTLGLVSRGSELVADLVASELAKKHEVIVLQGGPKLQKPYKIITISSDVGKLPVAPKTLLDKFRFRRYLDEMSGAITRFTTEAITYLEEWDPDIIVAVNGWPQLKVLHQFPLRGKVVVFGHAGIGYHDEDTLRERPDLFVALSHDADRWAQTIATKKTRIVHIPNPVNLAIYKEAKPDKQALEKPIVLVVGALTRYKNISMVIKAVEKTPYSLIVVGEGEEELQIKKIAAELISAGRISFIKALDPSYLAKIYKSVNVFCFVPDAQEAFGRVYLEAMCANLPIVASDDPIRRDIIGIQGFYADPHKVDMIVEALKSALAKGKIDYSEKLKEYHTAYICQQIESAFTKLLSPTAEKLKIAILHMTLGLVDRGSELSTDIIAENLAKTEDVLVLRAGGHTGGRYPVKRIYHLKEEPLPAPRNLFEKVLFHLYLDKASLNVRAFTDMAYTHLQKFIPDIVIATNGAPQVSLVKRLKPAPKIVVFGRAGIGYHDRDNLLAGPDLFVALSKGAYNWAKKYKRKKTRLVMIPNPLEVAIYERAQKIKLNLPSPVLMVVGALTKYKNIDTVIRAVRETDISLLLIGDGEEHEAIARELQTFTGNFRWIRHIDPSELPRYYAAADAFCFIPDPQEAFGRVYLEAMASGLPIIASDDPIRRSIVGAHGIYVNPHNHEAVVTAIQQVVQRKNVDYTTELVRYNLATVIKQLRKELYALIN